jgi:hypothetical protein
MSRKSWSSTAADPVLIPAHLICTAARQTVSLASRSRNDSPSIRCPQSLDLYNRSLGAFLATFDTQSLNDQRSGMDCEMGPIDAVILETDQSKAIRRMSTSLCGLIVRVGGHRAESTGTQASLSKRQIIIKYVASASTGLYIAGSRQMVTLRSVGARSRVTVSVPVDGSQH